MKWPFAIVAGFVIVAKLTAASWPPSEGAPGNERVSAEEIRLVWDRYEAASTHALGSAADIGRIQKTSLPYGAELVELRWISPTTAIGTAEKHFKTGTSVTYLVVFEKKSSSWQLLAFYTAMIACAG